MTPSGGRWERAEGWSCGRESLDPTLTNNHAGGGNARRSTPGRKKRITRSEVLNVGAAGGEENRADANDGRGAGAAGQERALLEVSDEALVFGRVGILVQPVVQLGRHGQPARHAP